jgi:cysteine-rich repeat protein
VRDIVDDMVRGGSIGIVGVVFASLACGGADDGGGGAETESVGATEPGDDDAPGDDDGTASDPDSTGGDDDGGGLCGNGVLDPDEDCDDGPANSDTEPDACRTDCREAQCNDGVLDPMHGEECDDGGNNGSAPNACRVTCMLPSCGDGTQDKAEACDDGNAEWGDSCYECSRVWYFILNAPAGGDPSILRTTRDGEPIAIVQGEPAYAGIEQLALAEAGATLFALQSDGAVDRVLFLDPVSGALGGEVDIGMAALGYDPEAHAMARGSDGLLWIALTGGGSTRMVTVDPESLAVNEALDLGGVTIEDMTADTEGGLYLTTGSGNAIVRVDIAGPSSATFADAGDSLSTPIGIAYDTDEQLVWVANNPPGAPVDVVRFDLAGTVTPYSIAGTDIEPYVRGLAIDVGGVVLAAEQNLDRVVAVQNFDAVQDIFTSMVDAPLDVVVLDMAR